MPGQSEPSKEAIAGSCLSLPVFSVSGVHRSTALLAQPLVSLGVDVLAVLRGGERCSSGREDRSGRLTPVLREREGKPGFLPLLKSWGDDFSPRPS